MEELKEKLKKTSEMKDTICDWAKSEMAKGVECINAEEFGEVIDMIKDLASVEKYLAEACYYKKIVEAMDEAKREEEIMTRMGGNHEGMGYDPNRYANGRFAPKGHGNYTRGFHPSGHEFGMDMIPPYMMKDDPTGMGYPNEPHRSQSGNRMGMGYTEDIEEHTKMIRTMYDNAGTDAEKRKIKEETTRLLNEMR